MTKLNRHIIFKFFADKFLIPILVVFIVGSILIIIGLSALNHGVIS